MVLETESCSKMRQARIQVGYRGALHLSRRFLSRLPVRCPGDLADDLAEANRGDYQVGRIAYRPIEEIRVGPVKEILDPAGGVYQVHVSRSGSRSNSPGMPRRNPRISLMERCGTRLIENSL